MIQAKLEDGSLQTVKNQSLTTRYNVPTISFRDLAPGVQHTLTMNILGSSNYKLDGVRIYNPMQDQTKYAETDEQYATYINLREALINNGLSSTEPVSVTEVGEDDYAAVFGALFVDDVSKMALSHDVTHDDGTVETVTDYANVFEAYQKNSPKHEIYLVNNQAIVFVLSADAVTAAANGNLWIGLSAPDADKQSGTVEFKADVTQTLGTALDEYYPITSDRIGANNTVTIKNIGSNMISVTNLKITGNAEIYNAANGAKASGDGAAPMVLADAMPLVFEPLTMQTVKIAANNGVDPDAPASPDEPDVPVEPDEPDKPTWTDPMTLLSELFRWLLNSLRDLFSGFGGW